MAMPKHVTHLGRCAFQWANERYVDVNLLLATPESMQNFRHHLGTSVPAKRQRVDAPVAGQQQQTAPEPIGQQNAQGVQDALEQQGSKKAKKGTLKQQKRVQPAPQGRNQEAARSAANEDQQGTQQVQEPEGTKIQANKSVLAGASEYFRKRLDGWDDDPWTMTGADGKPLLVVGVREDQLQVAEALVRLMYEERVAYGTSALQLARMCQLADMWGADGCLHLCFRALLLMNEGLVEIHELVVILQVLPQAVEHWDEHAVWKHKCINLICTAAVSGKDVTLPLLHFFHDVHELLTSPKQQLLDMARLPYEAIKAWAGSDDLVVDSEDSVAVALAWWARGPEGSKCSEEQLQELSGLLRVSRLSAAFRLRSLCGQRWFKFDSRHFDALNAALPTGVFQGLPDIPSGWLKPARKQLPLPELTRRCTITWDVPLQELQALFAHPSPSECSSPPVYVSGTGVELLMQAHPMEGGKTGLGAYIRLASYGQHGIALCPARSGMSCHFTIQRQVPGQGQTLLLSQADATLTALGLGTPDIITSTTPADLEPDLVDGCLKLKATIRLIPG